MTPRAQRRAPGGGGSGGGSGTNGGGGGGGITPATARGGMGTAPSPQWGGAVSARGGGGFAPGASPSPLPPLSLTAPAAGGGGGGHAAAGTNGAVLHTPPISLLHSAGYVGASDAAFAAAAWAPAPPVEDPYLVAKPRGLLPTSAPPALLTAFDGAAILHPPLAHTMRLSVTVAAHTGSPLDAARRHGSGHTGTESPLPTSPSPAPPHTVHATLRASTSAPLPGSGARGHATAPFGSRDAEALDGNTLFSVRDACIPVPVYHAFTSHAHVVQRGRVPASQQTPLAPSRHVGGGDAGGSGSGGGGHERRGSAAATTLELAVRSAAAAAAATGADGAHDIGALPLDAVLHAALDGGGRLVGGTAAGAVVGGEAPLRLRTFAGTQAVDVRDGAPAPPPPGSPPVAAVVATTAAAPAPSAVAAAIKSPARPRNPYADSSEDEESSETEGAAGGGGSGGGATGVDGGGDAADDAGSDAEDGDAGDDDDDDDDDEAFQRSGGRGVFVQHALVCYVPRPFVLRAYALQPPVSSGWAVSADCSRFLLGATLAPQAAARRRPAAAAASLPNVRLTPFAVAFAYKFRRAITASNNITSRFSMEVALRHGAGKGPAGEEVTAATLPDTLEALLFAQEPVAAGAAAAAALPPSPPALAAPEVVTYLEEPVLAAT